MTGYEAVIEAMLILKKYCEGNTTCIGCPISRQCGDMNPSEWEVPECIKGRKYKQKGGTERKGTERKEISND